MVEANLEVPDGDGRSNQFLKPETHLSPEPATIANKRITSKNASRVELLDTKKAVGKKAPSGDDALARGQTHNTARSGDGLVARVEQPKVLHTVVNL